MNKGEFVANLYLRFLKDSLFEVSPEAQSHFWESVGHHQYARNPMVAYHEKEAAFNGKENVKIGLS
jgi:hypothetical protein